MKNEIKVLAFTLAAILAGATSTQAQLTWNPAMDGGVTGGAGTWDNSTYNWWNSNAQIAWINGSNAVFNGTGDTVTIGAGSNITVNDITLAPGTSTHSFKPATDNEGFSVMPGAVWAINDNELKLIGNQANDFKLTMASPGTLALTGSGTFNAGEKQNGADWDAAGSTLNVQDTLTVRGNHSNVGKFSVVQMGGSTSFINERDSNQNFANDWILGDGEVAFGNRKTRATTLSGKISGSGKIVAEDLDGSWLLLANTNNTHTGGIGVDGNGSETILIIADKAALGAVPSTLDADNIILRNGGYLKLNGSSIELNANRGITLENGGAVINGSQPHTINGPITGSGGFTVGRASDTSANSVTLNSAANNYSGNTTITKGTLIAGIENALPSSTVLVIGGSGGSNSRFDLNGNDQTIKGLKTAGSNTRSIRNNNPEADATLTINSSSANSFGSNIDGVGNLHIVKEGSNRQEFSKSSAYTKAPASITVNEGLLMWNVHDENLGPVTVNNGGQLGGKGLINEVVLNSGARLSPGYWVGSLSFSGDVDLSTIAADNSGSIGITFNQTVYDHVIAAGTVNIGTELLGFSDFIFTDNYGLTNGTYTLIDAGQITGSLDPVDLTGRVGNRGALGTLSVDGTAIVLTVSAGDYSEFGQWANEYGLVGSDADPDFDYDGDSYSNFQEYVFGGDPTDPNVSGHVPVAGREERDGTEWLTITYGYRTAADWLTYESLTTDHLNMGTWTDEGITVMGTGTIDDDFGTITNAIPIDGNTGFLGVFVEQE